MGKCVYHHHCNRNHSNNSSSNSNNNNNPQQQQVSPSGTNIKEICPRTLSIFVSRGRQGNHSNSPSAVSVASTKPTTIAHRYNQVLLQRMVRNPTTKLATSPSNESPSSYPFERVAVLLPRIGWWNWTIDPSSRSIRLAVSSSTTTPTTTITAPTLPLDLVQVAARLGFVWLESMWATHCMTSTITTNNVTRTTSAHDLLQWLEGLALWKQDDELIL